MEKQEVKNKILWYCGKLNIEPPKNWSYAEVKKVADEINKKMERAPILVCNDCLKVDISYGHECDINRVMNEANL